MTHTSCLLAAGVALIALCVTPASAQWRVGPVYPAAPANPYRATPPNYNPFRYDIATGRHYYAPIPYDEFRSSGPNYDPYRFNWHSGRWDYYPFPAEQTLGVPTGVPSGSYYTTGGDHAHWYHPLPPPLPNR